MQARSLYWRRPEEEENVKERKAGRGGLYIELN
jgi:hypothetical protein